MYSEHTLSLDLFMPLQVKTANNFTKVNLATQPTTNQISQLAFTLQNRLDC